MGAYAFAESTAVRATTDARDVVDLLASGQCDPRCLLAMDSPPGPGPWCSCTCAGRWHAALTGSEVLPWSRL